MTTLIPKFDLKDGGATPTGAVNRPINERLSEIVSVKDFGATGDGTTDDTAAIQAAINAVQTSTFGGTVYFPKGNYKTSSTLVILRTVTLKGDGPDFSSIKPTSALTAPCLRIGVDGDTPRPAGGFIENISFDGTSTTNANAQGLNLWCSGVEIRNTYVLNFAGIGVYATQAWTTQMSNCLIQGNKSTGIYLDKECHDFGISFSRILYSTDYGIRVISSNSVKIYGCDIEQNTYGGVYQDSSNVVACRNLIIRDNYFEANGPNATTPGIGYDVSTNMGVGTDTSATIHGNYFEPGGSATVHVNGTNGVSISQNIGAIYNFASGSGNVSMPIKAIIPLSVKSNSITNSTPVQITNNYDGYSIGNVLLNSSMGLNNPYYKLTGALQKTSATGGPNLFNIQFTGNLTLNPVVPVSASSTIGVYLQNANVGFVTDLFQLNGQNTNQNLNYFLAALTSGTGTWSITDLSLIVMDTF